MKKYVISPENMPRKVPVNTFLLVLILLHLLGAAGWFVAAIASGMVIYSLWLLSERDKEIHADIFINENRKLNGQAEVQDPGPRSSNFNRMGSE